MIYLLLGRTRALRRQALDQSGLLGADPFGRPVALHLVSTELQCERLRAMGTAGFSPLVYTLTGWCEALWSRAGDGRAVLGDETVALCARWLLDRHPGRWPTLSAVPDRSAVARELVRIEARTAASRTRSAQPEVADAIDLLRSTLDGLPHGGIRRMAMLEQLLVMLEQPSDALGRALLATPTVLFDELPGSTPLEAELIVAMSRAFARAGVTVVLATASGRDRGGAEAGLLLGWEQPTDREGRVFVATKHLREAAFTLIETGEASVLLATEQGVREISEGAETGPRGAAPRTLADAYADGWTLPARDLASLRAQMGPVELLHPADPVIEARAIAKRLHALLSDGVDPRECAVALGDRSSADEMAAALRDLGIACRGPSGQPLRSHPLGWAVATLAGQALEGFTADGLCDLADFVDWPLSPEPEPETEGIPLGSPAQRLRQWCRAARIRGGRPRSWPLGAWAARTRTVDPRTWNVALRRMDALATLLEPLAEQATPLQWYDRLMSVFSSLDLAGRARQDEVSLRAWAVLLQGLADLVHDLRRVHDGVWAASSLREALEERLEQLTFDPGPATALAVPLVLVEELPGIVPRHLFLTGLVRGTFPATPPPAILGEPSSEGLHEARFLLASLLREALDPTGALQTLVLSWPATRGGAPTGPSLLLAELLELPTSLGKALGELCTTHLTETALESARRTDRLAAAALARAAMARDGEEGAPEAPESQDWWGALDPVEQLSVRIQVEAVRDRQGPLGPRDGLLSSAPAVQTLTVTALETYVRCPARYWYTYVLALSPPDRSSPELEPRRRGTVLHRILEKFLLGRNLAPLSGESKVQEAREQLFQVASEVLDQLDQEGGFDPLFQRYARARWTAGLIDDAPAGVLRAWLDAEIAAPLSFPEAVEQPHDGLRVGPVTLRGVLDRVDRYPSGVRLVTDYKTGTPPPRSWVEEGFSLQPIAYSAMVEAATGQPVAASFLSLGRPDELKRTAYVGHPKALDEVCSPEERRRAVALDDQARAALLAKAGEAAQRLVDGHFPPSPHPADVAGCPYCPFRRICRIDAARHGHPSARDLLESEP